MSQPSKDSKAQERRRFKRVDVRLKVAYKLQGETTETEIASVDISAGGACIWFNKLIKKGAAIELKAYIKGDKEVVSCAGTIVWQSLRPVKAEDGKYYYQTGVQFADMDLKERMKLIYYCHNAVQGKTTREA